MDADEAKRRRADGARRACTKHGMARTPHYLVWCAMKNRCYNPKNRQYPDYGGRGITVCDRWRSDFAAFYADMGARPSPKHSIERIDNDGPYAPENCRWATMPEQGRNTRTTHFVTYKGETKCVTDWAILLGIPMKVLSDRINKRGWSIEKAFTTPVRPWGPGKKRPPA